MSSYTMDHKYDRCTRQREQPGTQNCNPLALVGYEIVTVNNDGYLPSHIQRALNFQ